jgi:hypothetical protein
MKSRPDILIFQGASIGGHENARESREEQNPGEKMGSRNVRNINKCEHVFNKLGRSGVLWDHSGGRELCFLSGYKNFGVQSA